MCLTKKTFSRKFEEQTSDTFYADKNSIDLKIYTDVGRFTPHVFIDVTKD